MSQEHAIAPDALSTAITSHPSVVQDDAVQSMGRGKEKMM